ncbi:MAG TPA: WecB/TagA/CpsF family glycosyltransferase [Acidimicrobiales bacterium]|nr:WecB/TagA/CpsF family glycosyltransferase [Acidimicrobiales bacterium]
MASPDHVRILGVPVEDHTRAAALDLIESLIRAGARTHVLYIANAHTLNLAHDDPSYRDVLCRADHVFGDGSGVAIAARLRGVRLKANLNGTDLMPAMLRGLAGRGYRYFLLGSSEEVVNRAAAATRRDFPGWELVGHRPGYLDEAASILVCAAINEARPDVLMVGMGNPAQERWIHDHRHLLNVPVCVGVGGLFDRWAGDHDRAPRWMRRAGLEWVHRMYAQPQTRRRYLVGNPKFLWRVLRARGVDRRQLTLPRRA